MPIKNKADRATQFLPFDSVKGFRQAIIEAERVVVQKRILGEEDARVLSNKLSQLKKNMMVKVVYFSDLEYLEYVGIVTRVDFTLKTVTIVKTKIAFEDILDITSEEIVEVNQL